jgi:8-oxo-dGTP pyrophosphatase MutT (NUDIX family)
MSPLSPDHTQLERVSKVVAGTESIRDLIFISYCHQDHKWLDSFEKYLSPIKPGLIKTWSDTQIQAGVDWKKETECALASAKVAILLVTPDYLYSDLTTKQLGPLLDVAEKEGLMILWIAVRPCLWQTTPFAKYKALNDPKKPLSSLNTKSLEKEWVGICEKIGELPQLSSLIKSALETPSTEKGGPIREEKGDGQKTSRVPHGKEDDSKEALEKSTEGEQLMDKGATLALSDAQIQKPLLLAGYIYVEDAGRELVLIRGNGRLPLMRLYTGGEGTLESAIDNALLDLFEDLGISIKDVLMAGFSKPFHCPLYKVNRQNQTVERRPCVFFKLRLNRTIEGIKTTWRDKHYRWEPKTRISKIWARGQFTYAEKDVDESLMRSQTPFDDDPYAAIQEDWISMELGFKLLECAAMFIFRQNEKSEIEFLIMRRRDNDRWEYPKGGLHYHETPLEGALREIDEEAGIQEHTLHYCASLGWRTADWQEGKRFFDILRVHCLAFFYSGNPAAIDLDGSHNAYAWCPFEEARERILIWLPYAAEFFRRWQEKRQEIYQVAGIENNQS